VTLNAIVTLDADLKPFRNGEPTLDGKERPGLKRDRGHSSLAGHRTQLLFRNLRLKTIQPSATVDEAQAPSPAAPDPK